MGMIHSKLVTETKKTRHIFEMSLHLSPAQPSPPQPSPAKPSLAGGGAWAHQLLSPARPGRVFAPRAAEAVLPPAVCGKKA